MRYTKVDIKGVRTFMESIQNLLQQLQRMQWSDYLDIAVVAFLIYKILPLIKTPSTTRIAKAVVVVLVIAWLTDLWHLYTVAFIMKQFLSVGLLALVILFQPELRRMLENVGRKTGTLPFFGQHRTGEESAAMWSEAINDICASVEAMSMDKTGALIAIELKTGLSEIAATGTTVDARLSSELLETIFYEGCPLHDGAVIVRDGRIYAAGCYLPLSANTEIARELGTRHRAALGLSENSDAVVIVVSEETGVISVAQNGILVRRLDRISLMRILKRELIPEPKKRGQSSEEQDN